MAKGGKQPGAGRPKGSPNKATANAREAIAKLVDDNAPRMQAWLEEIAKEHGPLVAWKCMADVIEYHVPKLARTEVTGEGGGPVRVQRIERVIVKPENRNG
jgi:hypothetical protein